MVEDAGAIDAGMSTGRPGRGRQGRRVVSEGGRGAVGRAAVSCRRVAGAQSAGPPCRVGGWPHRIGETAARRTLLPSPAALPPWSRTWEPGAHRLPAPWGKKGQVGMGPAQVRGGAACWGGRAVRTMGRRGAGPQGVAGGIGGAACERGSFSRYWGSARCLPLPHRVQDGGSPFSGSGVERVCYKLDGAHT